MSAETREAGRTLDAEIAEKVMGWVVNRRDGGHWNTVGSYHPRLIIGSYNCCEGWSPSTEIAAAWEVVEKMADAGKVFIVKADGLRDGTFNPRYTVFCDNHPVVHARTAPLAICLSALRAATPGGADGAERRAKVPTHEFNAVCEALFEVLVHAGRFSRTSVLTAGDMIEEAKILTAAQPAEVEGLRERLRRIVENAVAAGAHIEGKPIPDDEKRVQADAYASETARLQVSAVLELAALSVLPAPAREPDLEALAEAVHDAYLETCARLGWGVKPENQVTYSALTEDSKELDRASVRAVLRGIGVAPEPQGTPDARLAATPKEENDDDGE